VVSLLLAATQNIDNSGGMCHMQTANGWAYFTVCYVYMYICTYICFYFFVCIEKHSQYVFLMPVIDVELHHATYICRSVSWWLLCFRTPGIPLVLLQMHCLQHLGFFLFLFYFFFFLFNEFVCLLRVIKVASSILAEPLRPR
jgi:hypothetical protein